MTTTATTSTNKLLADTARWCAFQIGRLPADQCPDIASLWASLVDDVESARSSGSAELAVLMWRSSMIRLLKAAQEEHTNGH